MVRHNAEEVVRVIAGDIGLALPAFGPIKQWCLSSVFYSAAARLSLCSIWDGEENDYGQQTVEHFKGKLVEMLYAYASSSTSFKDELNLKASARIREVAEELFQTYWQTGNFYRGSSEKTHRIMAVPPRSADCERVAFLRGVVPGLAVRMSGAGCYQVGTSGNLEDACRFFGFGEPVTGKLLGEVASTLDWKPFPKVEYVEYLNTSIGSGRRSYWDSTFCSRDGLFSLARYGQKGTETYVMYQVVSNGAMKAAVLPAWRYAHPWGDGIVADYTTKEYLRLAASALSERGNLPPIVYSIHGQLVHVRLGYLLPVAEENFFRLYSWPENFANIGQPVRIGNENFEQQTSRVMTIELFRAFRKMMEHQGYSFGESKEV